MNTLEGIKEELKKLMPMLSEKYSVKEIGIFGSYARHEQKDRSDIDILIDFYEKPDIFTFIEIQQFLSKRLRKKIDLVMKSSLKKHIGKRIKDEVLYI